MGMRPARKSFKRRALYRPIVQIYLYTTQSFRFRSGEFIMIGLPAKTASRFARL